MPNWCHNNVSISHADPDKLRVLVEAVNAKRFLDFAIPVPHDLAETVAGFQGNCDEQTEVNLKKHGAKDWYDFCVSRWGTKWDVEAYDTVEFDPAGITFGFDSAWAPPTGAYEALVEAGFSVTAFYYEPGEGIAGKWSGEDGDQCWEIGDMTSEQVQQELPEDLDEIMCISENME